MLRRQFLQAAGVATAAAGASTLIGSPPASAAQSGTAGAAPSGGGRHMRFGVNYIPSKNWWYQWYDWDPPSITRDLHAVAGLGFDHIRVQCLWPAFQPNPALVSQTALGRLRQLLDIAHGAGLDVEITLLDGYLSGFLFRPAWQQPGMDFFTDPTVLAAQKLLLRSVATDVAGHPALMGVDLGNEPDWIPYLDTISGVNGYNEPTDNAATAAQGQAWAAGLLALADQLLPGKVNVVGANANAWAGDIRVFTPQALAAAGTVTSIHDYYYPGTQFEQVHAAEYMTELATAYAADPARQVWVEEFGYSLTGETPAQQLATADYAEAVVRNLMTCGNLFGWAIWASHDIDAALTGFNASEYHFGMLDLSNKPTPLGQRIAALIAEFRSAPPPAASRTTALVIPGGVTATYDTIGKYFFQLILHGGIRPALVLESRATDSSYLTARGITTLVKTSDVDSFLANLPAAQLSQAYNNTGITSAGNADNGNFDGAGNSYPADQLARAGFTPGATVTAAGTAFTWAAPPDTFDNLAGAGRPVMLNGPPGAATLALLGAASYGPYTGKATVTYTDGTSDIPALSLSDWTLNQNSEPPAGDNQIAAKVTSLNAYGGAPSTTDAYIFATKLPIDGSRQVAKLALPGPRPSGTTSITVSVTLGQANTGNGLSQIECGDGKTQPVTAGGQSGRETVQVVAGDLNMYFQFATGLASNGSFHADFTVTYFDQGTAAWQLQYDSNDSSAPVGGAYKTAGTVQQRSTSTWKTAQLSVGDARFAGRENCGGDFRIFATAPVIIHSVQVTVSGTGVVPDSVPHIFAVAFGS
jgi:hypothetical protein